MSITMAATTTTGRTNAGSGALGFARSAGCCPGGLRHRKRLAGLGERGNEGPDALKAVPEIGRGCTLDDMDEALGEVRSQVVE